MENGQKAALRRNHVPLVQDLEPRGGVLDSLYEDGVLTENDCERITNAPTRKERCQLLLHLVPTRGPSAYGSFRKALITSNYDFLAEKLGDDHSRQAVARPDNQHSNFNDQVENTHNSAETETVETPCEVRWCMNCADFIEKVLQESCAENLTVKVVIETCGCLILDNVEPNDVTDRLFQDEVIGTDDVDLVKSGVTRRKRCELLLQLLIATPNKNALDSMVIALSKKYKYIANKIRRGDKKDMGNIESTNSKTLYTRQYNTSRNTQANCIKQLSENNNGLNGDSKTEETVVKQTELSKGKENPLQNERGDLNVIDGGHVGHSPLNLIAGRNTGTLNSPTKANTKGNKTRKNAEERRKEMRATDSSFEDDQIRRSKTMAVIPSQATHKNHRLTVAFNYLSTLINQGEFVKYENISSQLQRISPRNYDLLCIIGYLNASRDLFRTDFDSAKRNIQATMELVPKTSNPRYFILELFTAKTRMYITQKKLEKLQTTLDEAMMLLETDPEGCAGRAAGWLYINDARNKTAQFTCLNLSKPNALKSYELLFARAKTSFQRSMNNFKLDGGKDGPFGFGYALCRLVILLLRCGDNGMTMASLKPPADDVYTAGQYLHHLEDSNTPIPKILDMHFCLAKCDYQYRRNNLIRSLQHAQTAYDLANELNMLEFTEHAHNRVKFLRSVAPMNDSCHDISEEEAVPSSRHTKISTIYLEDDTLTLWRPTHDRHQYYLIPGKIRTENLSPVLQSYYTKFDCVTSVLLFDDALPIFASQSTNLKPTDDYTILRDYHQIQGLWFKPDIEERLGPDEKTTLGNIKLSIALDRREEESIFTRMNLYFLEVLDYPAEDKSVSRLLLTKHVHEEFEKYDITKAGGPIQLVKSVEDSNNMLELHYLRVCYNYVGRKWRHEVEFMMEEDPWPLCRIIPVNNNCQKKPTITAARDIGADLPCRYKGASWRETLAGLFVWSLRTYIVWLVFERLHDKVKHALDLATRHVSIKDVVHTECPLVCREMFDTYNLLSTFIAKCQNEQDLKDLLRIFLSIHRCESQGSCTLVSLKTLNSAQVLPAILFLLEKIIACATPNFRYEITSTIMPWSIMGYYCSDLKITSHRKMVIFISQLHGISTEMAPNSPNLIIEGLEFVTGYDKIAQKYLNGNAFRKRGCSSSSRMSVSSIDSL